jgi:hypothetical protein
MTKSLDDVCKQLQAVAGALELSPKASGADALVSPDYAEEHISSGPFAVSYPRSGSIDAEELPATKGSHEIWTEIHFPTTVLEITLEAAIPVVEQFAKAALADPTLAGTCDTIVDGIRYQFGRLDWGGKKENHVGIRFITTVKIRATS